MSTVYILLRDLFKGDKSTSTSWFSIVNWQLFLCCSFFSGHAYSVRHSIWYWQSKSEIRRGPWPCRRKLKQVNFRLQLTRCLKKFINSTIATVENPHHASLRTLESYSCYWITSTLSWFVSGTVVEVKFVIVVNLKWRYRFTIIFNMCIILHTCCCTLGTTEFWNNSNKLISYLAFHSLCPENIFTRKRR